MNPLEAETDFGLNLLNEASGNGATIISPLSIALALSLLHLGAGGQTKSQIKEAISRGSSDEQLTEYYSSLTSELSKLPPDVEFHVANTIYVRDSFPLNQTYVSEINNRFLATAEELDFANKFGAAITVNTFVKNITNGLITHIVDGSVFDGSDLILVNALYFKSQWRTEFEKSLTIQDDFFTSGDSSKKLLFMKLRNKEFEYMENDEVQLLSLPFENPSFSFNIFLPKDRDGLERFQNSLTGTEMVNLLNSTTRQPMDVTIPKFRSELRLDFNDILKNLGIKDMFKPEADFAGIAPGIYTSKVIHKAVIEVNEDGVEAAAVTALIMVQMSASFNRAKPIVFNADHPFIYTLTYEKHVVFMGVYE